jgi:hypothetical protein
MRNRNMNAAAARQIAATMPPTNGHRPAVVTDLPITAQPKPRLIKRLWAIFSTGELLITPMTAHKEEHHEYAQRWPAPAIAAVLVSAGGVIISAVLTLSLAGFMWYVNSNKDGSTQRESSVRELLETKNKVDKVELRLDMALRENGDLKARVATLEGDMKVVRLAQKLQ